MIAPAAKDARRVALVTGSTSGIGAAIARRLAADGFAVALHSRQSADTGRAMAAELEGASYHQVDLADETAPARLIDAVLAHHGRLDVLINNAAQSGVIPHQDLAAATPAIWRELYDVNVIAPWSLITCAEAALRASASRTPDAPSASIVNISSHAGVRPKGASIPYAVSKAALNHMTRLLALSLGPDIRVNAIAPGLVDTPLTADWQAARTLWSERSPMRRAAQPQDIAALAAMVVASDYLTGEVLVADGGLNLT